jgi:hypothetical protein
MVSANAGAVAGANRTAGIEGKRYAGRRCATNASTPQAKLAIDAGSVRLCASNHPGCWHL